MSLESQSSDEQSLSDFDDVLEGRVPNGIVLFTGVDDAGDLASKAGVDGWKLIHIDGSAVSTKADYLQAWCDAAAFPDTFGHNWDALADALTDLSWLHASGYVVLVEGLDDAAEGAATGWEIMSEACDSWADDGTPFVVLRRNRPQ